MTVTVVSPSWGGPPRSPQKNDGGYKMGIFKEQGNSDVLLQRIFSSQLEVPVGRFVFVFALRDCVPWEKESQRLATTICRFRFVLRGRDEKHRNISEDATMESSYESLILWKLAWLEEQFSTTIVKYSSAGLFDFKLNTSIASPFHLGPFLSKNFSAYCVPIAKKRKADLSLFRCHLRARALLRCHHPPSLFFCFPSIPRSSGQLQSPKRKCTRSLTFFRLWKTDP